MFSYIFMKILERRPEKYDLGINIISAGHAKRIKEAIVKTYVKPNMRMLDIGCGTGELIVDAARAGATVVGMDISEKMLSAAQKKTDENDFGRKVKLHQASVAEIDSLFEKKSFDLITATLVFSELYPEERRWVLTHIARTLRPTGIVVLADEVKPCGFIKKVLHVVVRLPLTIITYLIAQRVTYPLTDLPEEISQTGLKIIDEKRSLLGSFTTVVAKKSTEPKPSPELKQTKGDFSFIKMVWDYAGRWFPNPVDAGLREIGKPDENSPVLVTSNFHLTVSRVKRALKDENCYLLVAPTDGINVWCAAGGGLMNTDAIVRVIKTSGIGERVRHRQLILPQFSASGVDRELLKQKTGWDSVFGPAYAHDIPSFLKRGFEKTPDQCLAKFPLRFRAEMLIAMNFLVWMLIAITTIFINPDWLFEVTALFWVPGIILYLGFPVFPGQSGWLKAGVISVLEIIAIALFSALVLGDSWWTYWGWMVAGCAITMWLGFDLKGIVGGNPSEPIWLFQKLGLKSFGRLLLPHVKKPTPVLQNGNACVGCQTCLNVCPKGVYGLSEDKKKVIVKKKEECFNCNGCVMQCSKGAISIK